VNDEHVDNEARQSPFNNFKESMMNLRTAKDDWLNLQLAADVDVFVSGHPTFSERLGLSADTAATVRWFGNRRVGYTPMLVIEAAKSQWAIIEKMFARKKPSDGLEHFLTQGKAITILFSGEIHKPSLMPNGTPFNEANLFHVSQDGHNLLEMDSNGLVNFFHNINPEFVSNSGTTKSINKSHNDLFQLWTAKNLSRYLSVGDIDALDTNQLRLYELKRVEEDVNTWEPYLDESSQYTALRSLATSSGYSLILLAYNVSKQQYASHKITFVSNTEIRGERTIYDNNGFGEPQMYQSSRRRQQGRNY